VEFLQNQGFVLKEDKVKDREIYVTKDSQCIINTLVQTCYFSRYQGYSWTHESIYPISELRLEGTNLVHIPVVYKGT